VVPQRLTVLLLASAAVVSVPLLLVLHYGSLLLPLQGHLRRIPAFVKQMAKPEKLPVEFPNESAADLFQQATPSVPVAEQKESQVTRPYLPGFSLP
jgi:hypothetical protein